MRATVDRPGLDSQGRSPLIKIRRVRKGDLSKVRDVIEQAFADFFERQMGTRPRQVFGGAQYVHHRWLMEPWGCFVAEEGDGKIVGAAVAVMWGTRRPRRAGRGAAELPEPGHRAAAPHRLSGLLRREQGDPAGARHLSEQPQAPDLLPEVRLPAAGPGGDHRQDARPARDRRGAREARPSRRLSVRRYSTLEEAKKKAAILKLRRITNGVWRGLDVGKEVEIVDGLALGDTLLLEKGREVIGFAICHTPGVSEAPHGSALREVPGHRRAPPQAREPARPARRRGGHRPRRCSSSAWWRPPTPTTGPRTRRCSSAAITIDFTMVRMKRGKQDRRRGPQRSGAGRLALIRPGASRVPARPLAPPSCCCRPGSRCRCRGAGGRPRHRRSSRPRPRRGARRARPRGWCSASTAGSRQRLTRVTHRARGRRAARRSRCPAADGAPSPTAWSSR